MSTNHIDHSTEVTSRQPDRRHHPALFISGIIVLALLVVTLITMQSRNSQAAKSANVQPIVYSNALEMQYAQPWLDKQQTAVPTVHYSNALEMQYAQPWLDKQPVEAAPAFSYTDFLALFYAQPWLEKQQSHSCNGRLDEMYACQYGNWQPQK